MSEKEAVQTNGDRKNNQDFPYLACPIHTLNKYSAQAPFLRLPCPPGQYCLVPSDTVSPVMDGLQH